MQKRIRIDSGESMNNMLKKIRRGESSDSSNSISSSGSIRSNLKHKKFLNTKFDAPLPEVSKTKQTDAKKEVKIKKT